MHALLGLLPLAGIGAVLWWIFHDPKKKRHGRHKSASHEAALAAIWGAVGAWAWSGFGKQLLARIPVKWRIVGGLVLVVVCLIVGPLRDFALPLFLATLGLIAAAVLHGNRKRVTGPEKIVRDWTRTIEDNPSLAPLKGSSAAVVDRDRTSYTIAVELAGGRTPADVQKLAPNLESVFHNRPGSLRVLADRESAHIVQLRFVIRDVLAGAIPWEAPHPAGVHDPIRLGMFEDGKPAEVSLVPEPGRGVNLLVGGLPGSGKSSILNVVVAHLAACPDCLIAAVDAQGTELGLWADVVDRNLLALEGGQEARAVLSRLVAIMGARSKRLRRNKLQFWTPTPENPHIVVVCDEVADLAEHMDLVDELARKGRKCAITTILATQRPSSTSLGAEGKEALSKFATSICLQTANQTETNIILGTGASGEGWRADTLLQAAGEFLIRDRSEHRTVRRARALRITGADVATQALACRESRPALDPDSASAAPVQPPLALLPGASESRSDG